MSIRDRYLREKRDNLERPGDVYIIYKELNDDKQETGFSFCVDHKGIFAWKGYFSPDSPLEQECFAAAFGSALKDYLLLRQSKRAALKGSLIC